MSAFGKRKTDFFAFCPQTAPFRWGFRCICTNDRVRSFPSSPEAPLLGELLSDSETERLYEGEPDREPQRNRTSPSRLRRATSPIEGRPWHTVKPCLFARGSPTRGAGAKRLRGCTKDSLPVSRSRAGKARLCSLFLCPSLEYRRKPSKREKIGFPLAKRGKTRYSIVTV